MGSFEEIDQSDLTPAMRQYVDIKRQNMDSIVLFRMGDFYETFYDDAIVAADVLNITLTSRKQGKGKAPLAGIPFHAAETYVKRLIEAGKKVVIVEQLEDPKKAKKVVKRGVTRIITPGTVLEDNILSPTTNNYLASIILEGKRFGIAVCDVSTSEVFMTQSDDKNLLFGELEKFRPAELVVKGSFASQEVIDTCQHLDITISRVDDELFDVETALHIAGKQFDKKKLNAISKHNELAISALGPLVSYVKRNLLKDETYLSFPELYSLSQSMVLDQTTQRNLELVSNQIDGSRKGTLFSTLNHTMTGMGARYLQKLILSPSLDLDTITKRQDAVESLFQNPILLGDLRESLRGCSDLQRLVARATYGSINPKEVISLAQTIETFSIIKKLLTQTESSLFSESLDVPDNEKLASSIRSTIKDEPATSVREGNIIKESVSDELDELRTLASDSKTWLRDFEEQEREKTGIKSLKVKYNKVFGYFIEVTKANLHLVPDHYIRKQTQVNSERYITDELKDKESQLLGARERANTLEFELFQETIRTIVSYQETLKRSGSVLSLIDAMQSLAHVANKNSYCRPELSASGDTVIQKGRHPVVEQHASFVANNTLFKEKDTLHVITGPNMAGKSTYLRQVALITLMAQTGSFVPATDARIAIVDRIFTRVGAHDNLSQGESTFMVEMTETANILKNATSKSLIILDEIGRGTSTYDGFSIAWAVARHIVTRIGAKALFATHYHQLNTLAGEFESVKNYHSTVEESEHGLIFLRKILPGSTDKSFGVHVAKIAGVPDEVISDAQSMMETLEAEDRILAQSQSHKNSDGSTQKQNIGPHEQQSRSEEVTEEKLGSTGQLSLESFEKN
ncbi:MAG: DNA mismatch repair protein MutS [Candidatus Woesearchaeota archaeon]